MHCLCAHNIPAHCALLFVHCPLLQVSFLQSYPLVQQLQDLTR